MMQGVCSMFRGWLGKNAGNAEHPANCLKVRVAAAWDEALGIRVFEFVAANGRPLPAFSAGAHIDVHIERGLVRSYSLCSDPHATGPYRIAVKRVDNSRGGSAAMHERVRVGDELVISEPRNHFPLDSQSPHHVLVGAGIGITPLLAMGYELRQAGRPFMLHYFAHSAQHAAFLSEFADVGFESRIYLHLGLARDELRTRLARVLRPPAPGGDLCLCGPEGFMESALHFAGGHWPAQAIHLERFHADARSLAGPRHPFRVRLAESGRVVTVGAGQSIVEALESHGIQVMTSCREGVCGSCATRVIAGDCDHRDSFLSPAERALGDCILPCVSRARGRELVLDL
jgi:vanillate monooxygenase ferredoxin subunit